MEFVRHTVEINGCKLGFARGGKGVPLIYLHGTDGLSEWPALLDTLAQGFDVIAPDHPGFGGTEAPAWIDDDRSSEHKMRRTDRQYIESLQYDYFFPPPASPSSSSI